MGEFMPEQQDRSGLIEDFFSLPLGKGEVAFLYMGYSGVVLRIEDGAVAIDLADLLGDREIAAFDKLDLLLFTHSHYDHYNRARARKILESTNAHIIAQQQVAEDLKGRVPPGRLTVAEYGSTSSINGFEIVTVEGVHPRPIAIYRIEKGEYSIFHGGDSGYSTVGDYPAKLAFLPTGRPSPSCSPENALKFVRDIKPTIAVAMHGTPAQMNKFKDLFDKNTSETAVIIPKEYKVETVVP